MESQIHYLSPNVDFFVFQTGNPHMFFSEMITSIVANNSNYWLLSWSTCWKCQDDFYFHRQNKYHPLQKIKIKIIIIKKKNYSIWKAWTSLYVFFIWTVSFGLLSTKNLNQNMFVSYFCCIKIFCLTMREKTWPVRTCKPYPESCWNFRKI